MLSENFIRRLAQRRAESIFTKEYFKSVTDSWYMDELFYFEEIEIGVEGRKPVQLEIDLYMDELSKLFTEYENLYYGETYAIICYKHYKNILTQLLNTINDDQEKNPKVVIPDNIKESLNSVLDYFNKNIK